MQPLQGKIALVAGATRGAGRGIARALGEAGATVYCTGRSTRAKSVQSRGESTSPFEPAARSETIEETAELVTAAGGIGLAVQADHTVQEQVQAVFAQIKKEQGRIDILINDIWGGDELVEFGTPFGSSRSTGDCSCSSAPFIRTLSPAATVHRSCWKREEV
jgi:NAD(P)-dependent dehydrogenase (short-subunit alcohol dehydrogenase family)